MEKKQITQNLEQKNETLFSWLFSLGKAGVKGIPSMIKGIAIRLAIVFSFQIVFWWDAVSRYIPDIIKMPVIFLTATYNDVIPKTLYWIIVFTFGKKLFNRIKKTGFASAMRPIKWVIPELKKTFATVGEKAYPMFFIGGGIGLSIANNFASYSRFSGARNKFDKYFIALVISFTISYLLGEGRKHWIFKFFRLSVSDFSRLTRLKINYSEDYTFILLSSFVIGLLLDAPLILMKFMYGGYLIGGLFVIIGIVLSIVKKEKAVV